MAAESSITGLSELQTFLDTLAPKVEQNILRGALRAGASVIRDAARENCPTGAPSVENQRLYGAYLGALKSSIRAGSRSKNGVAVGYVKAGGKSAKGADVFWASFIEFGTGAHLIKPPPGAKAKALAFDGLVRRSVQHPGNVAKPYMRTAFDAKASAAIVAVGETIKGRLTKEGLDASDVAIGDE